MPDIPLFVVDEGIQRLQRLECRREFAMGKFYPTHSPTLVGYRRYTFHQYYKKQICEGSTNNLENV
jgi:hypothetical protein